MQDYVVLLSQSMVTYNVIFTSIQVKKKKKTQLKHSESHPLQIYIWQDGISLVLTQLSPKTIQFSAAKVYILNLAGKLN